MLACRPLLSAPLLLKFPSSSCHAKRGASSDARQDTPDNTNRNGWYYLECHALHRYLPPFGVVNVQVRVDIDATHGGEPSHLLVDALGHRLSIQKGKTNRTKHNTPSETALEGQPR